MALIIWGWTKSIPSISTSNGSFPPSTDHKKRSRHSSYKPNDRSFSFPVAPRHEREIIALTWPRPSHRVAQLPFNPSCIEFDNSPPLSIVYKIYILEYVATRSWLSLFQSIQLLRLRCVEPTRSTSGIPYEWTLGQFPLDNEQPLSHR